MLDTMQKNGQVGGDAFQVRLGVTHGGSLEINLYSRTLSSRSKHAESWVFTRHGRVVMIMRKPGGGTSDDGVLLTQQIQY